MSGGSDVIAGRSVLAIIAARGGSRGLPRKNVLPFRGRALIGWTIAAAQRRDASTV